MNQKLLNLIKERANGITVPEVLAKTELDYNGLTRRKRAGYKIPGNAN